MPRYKLLVEYNGAPFVGWQRQSNGRSVQQAMEDAVARFSGDKTVVHGAGRTDAGVHARGLTAHVDLTRVWRDDVVRDAINAHLQPWPIAVLTVETVADDFEARFSAVQRHYLYRILNRRAPAAVDKGFVWHIARRLDAAAMHDAAQGLLGKHDFTTFRASECQAASPVRTLDSLDVRRIGDMIEITTSARSFLHHQVRSMAGSLEHVGSGKWQAGDLARALAARDRSRCGEVAPACGLFLMRVDY